MVGEICFCGVEKVYLINRKRQGLGGKKGTDARTFTKGISC
jgi:hypothetical protein